MTPATTNRARDAIGRDFAVRGPRGAGRFQNVRGNRVSPEVGDDEVWSEQREPDANACWLINSSGCL
jgi:hypothetical protein